MSSPFTLFEISWEVCNKVGGIHTVLASKAKTLVERYGDDYVCVGPWLLSEDNDPPFEDDRAFEPFVQACRQAGIGVRVGRWQIPASPRAILVDFSSLYEEKDDVLADLWNDYGVDSLEGDWDYIEPVLFGHAAGRVIEKWWEEYLAPHRRRAVVQAHEWMTGSALLHLRKHAPAVGTVFTTHATMLGRALSSLGMSPDDGLGGASVEELAESHGVKAKHSMEGTCAREADVFCTVSQITAKEAELLHLRRPEPVTPNGIDLEVIDQMAGEVPRDEVRAKLEGIASRFFGEDVSDAAFVATSGRYEFHNKGFDVLLEALAAMEQREGRRVVLFVLAPAGNTGLRAEMLERADQPVAELDGPLGISTHNLFDEEHDPVHQLCAELGLDNARETRVKVLQIPIYLFGNDDLIGLPYEAVLRAMDLTCFPSYYEPWGYTPQESLALGVPTITTDYAGFGRWASESGFDAKDGIRVLSRVHVTHDEIKDRLADELEAFLAERTGSAELFAACRQTASRTGWSDFVSHYEDAYGAALECVGERLASGVQIVRRPKRSLEVRPARDGQRPRLLPFDVAATLPSELLGLDRLAQNYYWSWDPEGASLFEELSPERWRESKHDPLRFLQQVPREDLDAAAGDAAYLTKLERVLARFDAYLGEDSTQGRWRCKVTDDEPALSDAHPVAYFCAEYGIHESLKIYSGGLGVLAGDHVKSASDLNLPFVAVGLFYRMGYMGQRLSPTGEQVEVDLVNDPGSLPMRRVRGEDGRPLEIKLHLPGRELMLRAWRVDVGRVRLYLLDTDSPNNRPEDRDITRNLYGGGEETRLQQEIVLGRGGVRLLRKLGIQPSVFHMNEGHAAFLTLERVWQLTHKEGLTFEEASELVRSTTLFTTHTPVPAGHDRFGEDLMRRYFSDAPSWIGVPWETFWELGSARDPQADRSSFNMTYLAMNFASYKNGVSALHGIASRKLFKEFWPQRVESEIPVDSITNGIHLPTWTAPEIAGLVASESGLVPEDFDAELKDERLTRWWTEKQGLKRRLLAELEVRTRESFVERSDSPRLLEETLAGLTEDALLIGFARRFAPYKRADLMFLDPERLERILSNPDRPVRILVAGKAHPRDEHGKDILQSIASRTRDGSFVGKVIFLEDYDIELARMLMSGVDVWLNNPTRMLEASGTSGMKAAANGALNLSVGDGWWPEAYDGANGWMIDQRRSYDSQELQDQLDASVLYQLLEEEVAPLYFDRDAAGVPNGWLQRVRRCLATVPTVFNTDRMVLDYLERAYAPLATDHRALCEDKKVSVKQRVTERGRLRRGFETLEIVTAEVGDLEGLRVGDPVGVRLEVELPDLAPDDVVCELVLGPAREDGEIADPVRVPLAYVSSSGDHRHVFEGHHPTDHSGRYSYGIRVRGRDDDEFVVWA